MGEDRAGEVGAAAAAALDERNRKISSWELESTGHVCQEFCEPLPSLMGDRRLLLGDNTAIM